jgi:hypothetical protein
MKGRVDYKKTTNWILVGVDKIQLILNLKFKSYNK